MGSTSLRTTIGVGVALLALVAGWWWLSTPSASSGGFWSVSSADHDVAWVTGPSDTMAVVPADPDGDTTVAFELTNEGRLPMRIVDVWPDPPPRSCFWAPRSRILRHDPQTMYTQEGASMPAVGATIAPGASASLWLTGTLTGPASCIDGGIAMVQTVEVVASVAGRTSTLRVPIGYVFGYTDDLDRLDEQYGVTTIPPSPVPPPVDG